MLSSYPSHDSRIFIMKRRLMTRSILSYPRQNCGILSKNKAHYLVSCIDPIIDGSHWAVYQ